MITKIFGGNVITDRRIHKGLNVYISDDRILAVTDRQLPCDREIDATGLYVSPGFIDTHVHGGGGSDFMDGGVEPIVKAADFHLRHGTTCILPTTLACSQETLLNFLEDLRQVIDGKLSDSFIPGAHLEGPYFSHRQSGAQKPEYIRQPDKAEYGELLSSYGDLIMKWSFAPELEGSCDFCRELVSRGIVPSVGHSDATFEQISQVYALGCKHFTHLYSGMSTIVRKDGYRVLGAVESAYYFEDACVEVIADGKHLPPVLLELIVRQKGPEHVCLITDGMRGAGMPEGPSFLGRHGEEMPCVIEDGVAKLPDRTAFAGSVATADRLVRTMVNEARVDLCAAVGMMTRTPARILGLADRGTLQDGFFADIVLFDEDIRIQKVIAGGKVIGE